MPKLPVRGDGALTVVVKLMAITDSIMKDRMKGSPVYDFFQKLKGVEAKTNAQFVDVFFSTSLHTLFDVSRLDLNDYVTVVLAEHQTLGTLYFIEHTWGSKPEPSPDFWHSPGFMFDEALASLWSTFDGGIHINLIDTDRGPRTVYGALSTVQGRLFGSSVTKLQATVEKHRKLVEAGFPRTYMLLGKQGVGKTTFAVRFAHECGGRVLRVDSTGMTKVGARDLSLVLGGLKPDFLILDDIDKVADIAAAMPSLLSALVELKEKHPQVTLIMTANTLAPFDASFLRPGRIDEVLVFPAPGAKERRALLDGYLTEFDVPSLSVADIDGLLRATRGLTAAYLRDVAVQLKFSSVAEVAHTVRLLKRLTPKGGDASKPGGPVPETKKEG